MNEIPQRAFESALAAQARSVEVGVPPIDAVLAGARRRADRRRAVAIGCAVALVGVAGGLGFALGRSSGSREMPPGHPTNTASGQRSAGPPPSGAGIRHVPETTAYDGLAPGQRPMGEAPVVASGTEGGLPWQITFTVKPDGTFARLAMWKATGSKIMDETEGDPSGGAPVAAPLIFTGSSLGPLVFVVPMDTDKVVWTGRDGFRQETPTLPAHSYGPLGELRMAVFPSSLMRPQPGDEFTGYDASGKQLTTYIRVTPMMLGQE